MFHVLEHRNTGLGVHADLIEVEGQIDDGDLHELPVFVLGVRAGLDFEARRCVGQVLAHFDGKDGADHVATAGQGVARRLVPHRVGPRRGKGTRQVKTDLHGGCGCTDVGHEELHRAGLAGRDEDGGGLVAGHAEVDAVLDELDAAMLVEHGVALNVADLEGKGIDAGSHGARIVGPGVVAHQTFVVEAQIVVIEFLVEHRRGPVRGGQHEVDRLDVSAAEGVTHVNVELDFTVLAQRVGRPREGLGVAPSGAWGVNLHRGRGERVGHHFEARGTFGGVEVTERNFDVAIVASTDGVPAALTFAGRLTVDDELQALAVGNSHAVGRDVKEHLRGGPRTVLLEGGTAGVIEVDGFASDLRIAGLQRERDVPG